MKRKREQRSESIWLPSPSGGFFEMRAIPTWDEYLESIEIPKLPPMPGTRQTTLGPITSLIHSS